MLRSRAPRVVVTALVATSLFAAAGCGIDAGKKVEKGTATSAGAGDPGSPLDWGSCGDVECATLAVPLTYDNPDRGSIELALARRPASGDRIGTLLTNPGGPGVAATWLADEAEGLFPDEVLDAFDIVAWDPRGVGESTAIDCTDDLDDFWRQDRSPDTPAEEASNVAAAQRLTRGCQTRSRRLLPYVSSVATTHDMDTIRDALGEEKISYLGFSYGSYLGTLYANEYPERVRAMVLDGAVDPTLSSAEENVQQAASFEGALRRFFEWCADADDCAFTAGGDPQRGFERVMDAIDAEPMFASVDGEERELGPGEADLGVAEALYGGTERWPVLGEALAAAARGDGSGLLELSDEYTDRSTGGEYSNQTEAFYAISCLDEQPPASVDEVRQQAEASATRAPTFGPTGAWLGLPCTTWPVVADPYSGPWNAPSAPAIVVLGTTNDPATPFAWARSLADLLDRGTLVSLRDEGHTAYLRGNDCIDTAVNDYLLERTVPDDGTQC